MKKAADIREQFLKFFEEKHNSTRIKSSSLVPDNPTILLTTAGMVQFVPYFLGLETPPFEPRRATTCQKCARAGGKDSDIENVGRTPRHHTFFEMLGNFSFGDYYKREIIPWAWEFVTEVLKLDKDRLWITIFETDDEAGELWQQVGVPAERIKRKGKKELNLEKVEVEKDSAAEKSGLKVGDQILKLNDQALFSFMDLREFLQKYEPQQVITANRSKYHWDEEGRQSKKNTLLHVLFEVRQIHLQPRQEHDIKQTNRTK